MLPYPRCVKCGAPDDATDIPICKTDPYSQQSIGYLWSQLYQAAMDLRERGITWEQIRGTISDWEAV